MPLRFKDWESAIKDRWFERDVEIAVKLGLLTGHDDGMFVPDAPVTRAQLAAVLRRQYETEGREPVQKRMLSLVYIRTNLEKGNQLGYQSGSGFWLPGKPWRVMTNAHVVERLEEDVVTRSIYVWGNPAAQFSPIDGMKAVVLVMAHEYDLAVLEVEKPRYADVGPGVPCPQAALGGADPEQGQTVWAAGNPCGFPWDICRGVVRHPTRWINYWKKSQQVIGIDAPINPGNSGGMLIDYLGCVVGVPSAGVTNADSLNFAVPLSSVLEVLSRCP